MFEKSEKDLPSTSIDRVKFNQRTTFIFKSDGQMDYITSNNIVFSTKNLDFDQMEYVVDNLHISSTSRKKVTIKDAVAEEHDLLLITDRDEVYIFNMERLTLSKTKIKAEQALLNPYLDRVQVFTQFLVYDNILMVGHAHILSIFNMNAKTCKEKSWRHLVAPIEEAYPGEDDEQLSLQDILKDPFK